MHTAIESIVNMMQADEPDYASIDKRLEQSNYSQDEMVTTAIDVLSALHDENLNVDADEMIIPPTVWKSQTYPAFIRIMLKHGMDPNHLVADGGFEDNIMNEILYHGDGVPAVEALKILLEHGGNPNLEWHQMRDEDDDYYNHVFDSRTFFTDVLLIPLQDSQIRCWLTLFAFGLKCHDGLSPLAMQNGYDISILRDIDGYDYRFEFPERKTANDDSWIMHIFNRKTGEEIAVV